MNCTVWKYFCSPIERLHLRSLPGLPHLGFSRDPAAPHSFALKTTPSLWSPLHVHCCRTAEMAPDSCLLPQLLSARTYSYILNPREAAVVLKINTRMPIPSDRRPPGPAGLRPAHTPATLYARYNLTHTHTPPPNGMFCSTRDGQAASAPWDVPPQEEGGGGGGRKPRRWKSPPAATLPPPPPPRPLRGRGFRAPSSKEEAAAGRPAMTQSVVVQGKGARRPEHPRRPLPAPDPPSLSLLVPPLQWASAGTRWAAASGTWRCGSTPPSTR